VKAAGGIFRVALHFGRVKALCAQKDLYILALGKKAQGVVCGKRRRQLAAEHIGFARAAEQLKGGVRLAALVFQRCFLGGLRVGLARRGFVQNKKEDRKKEQKPKAELAGSS